ncbi:SDR family NAD(P)-dependent oxidoreductase [Falsirhodobacter deserti]|uniref:SDR family NAD(P)-dependent oxidoreductase n=1 Tax=Falsirhodobacter deserti TaxID=1365611 RepID=UPI000FE3F633|nr:SDR family NAD(P)-dependent oxidoreductase [Falsirhodobacter deserti]
MTLAVVTGASSGIGLEMARICVAEGDDLIMIANEPEIHTAAGELRAEGIHADQATAEGCATILDAIGGREVDLLFLNAGTSLVGTVQQQEMEEIERIIQTNILGTVRLAHPLCRRMVARGSGRILITGSIMGYMAGSWQTVYAGTKAFLNTFAVALGHELQDTGVSVTCLMPGATETSFFTRAGLDDTAIGKMKKDDPAMVARAGYDAMIAGRAQITPTLKNKLQGAASEVMPAPLVAGLSERMFKPRD